MSYEFWRAELASPKSQDRLSVAAEDVWGFWRIEGARTKPDYPFAAWEENGVTVFKFGRKAPIPAGSEDGQNALAFSFPHAIAVTEEVYKAALLDGTWSDGKPSRQPGGVADEHATEGQSNYAPVHEVLKERVDSLLEKIAALKPIDSQAKADKLAEYGQGLKAVLTEAAGAKAKESKPYDDALVVIDTNYAFANVGDGVLKQSRLDLREFLKAEDARLAKIAEEARKSSEAAGSADDAKPVEVAPPPKAKASSAFGRATVLRTVRKGVITDRAKFLRAVKDDDDVTELLQRKANALARAGTKKPGMEVVEERQ